MPVAAWSIGKPNLLNLAWVIDNAARSAGYAGVSAPFTVTRSIRDDGSSLTHAQAMATNGQPWSLQAIDDAISNATTHVT